MLGIVALIVGAGSLVLNIVGLAIPYWLYADVTILGVKIKNNVGLWKTCSASTCLDIPDMFVDSSLQATRALEILGVLLIAGAIVCAVLKLVAMKEQTMLPKVAGALAAVAGFFIIIGCIIYAAKYKKDYGSRLELHAGFGLCLVAGIGSIVAAGLFVSAKKDL